MGYGRPGWPRTGSSFRASLVLQLAIIALLPPVAAAQTPSAYGPAAVGRSVGPAPAFSVLAARTFCTDGGKLTAKIGRYVVTISVPRGAFRSCTLLKFTMSSDRALRQLETAARLPALAVAFGVDALRPRDGALLPTAFVRPLSLTITGPQVGARDRVGLVDDAGVPRLARPPAEINGSTLKILLRRSEDVYILRPATRSSSSAAPSGPAGQLSQTPGSPLPRRNQPKGVAASTFGWPALAILFVIIWVAIAFWPARVARRRGHSFLGYFIFSLIFFPLALTVAYLIRDPSAPGMR